MNKSKELVIKSLLSRLTDFHSQSTDPKFLEWTEELRDLISEFSDNKLQEKEQRIFEFADKE